MIQNSGKPKGNGIKRGELLIFCAPESQSLAEKICDHLNMPLSQLEFKQFSDGEWICQYQENIRGRDIFLVCSTMPPADNWIQMLMMIDAAKRASAERITAVIPYFGYARQERKEKPRTPITTKLMANCLEIAGVNRVLTMDLHAAVIQGFFEKPVDHLWGAPSLIEAVIKEVGNNLVGVAPDMGAIAMVRANCKRHDWPLAVIDKRRPKPNQVSSEINILGEVEGKDCLILDDMVDTFGTLQAGSVGLKKAGAKNIYAAITHPVLSGPALERLTDSEISTLWVSDTIPLNSEKNHPKIKIVSMAKDFASTIQSIHNEDSVSSLFSFGKD